MVEGFASLALFTSSAGADYRPDKGVWQVWQMCLCSGNIYLLHWVLQSVHQIASPNSGSAVFESQSGQCSSRSGSSVSRGSKQGSETWTWGLVATIWNHPAWNALWEGRGGGCWERHWTQASDVSILSGLNYLGGSGSGNWVTFWSQNFLSLFYEEVFVPGHGRQGSWPLCSLPAEPPATWTSQCAYIWLLPTTSSWSSLQLCCGKLSPAPDVWIFFFSSNRAVTTALEGTGNDRMEVLSSALLTCLQSQ